MVGHGIKTKDDNCVATVLPESLLAGIGFQNLRNITGDFVYTRKNPSPKFLSEEK